MALLDDILAAEGVMPPGPMGAPTVNPEVSGLLDAVRRDGGVPGFESAAPAAPKPSLRESAKTFVGDFLFGLGEAMKASASAPGRRGTMAGMGAGLQGGLMRSVMEQEQKLKAAQEERANQVAQANIRQSDAATEHAKLAQAIELYKASKPEPAPEPKANPDKEVATIVNDAGESVTTMIRPDGTQYKINHGKVKPDKPASAPNLQKTEIVDPKNPKGPPIFANFNPETGKYLDPDTGEVIPAAKPYERPQDPAIAAVRDLQATFLRLQLEGGGLTPNQRAELINSMRSQWTKATAPIMERRSTISRIDSGLAALKNGNRNAATQVLITTFNKLLDEGSVVREGEYARSAAGAPVMERIQASIQRLSEGGTSVSDDELRRLGAEAKNIAADLERASNDWLSNTRQGMAETLQEYKIPESRVFGSSDIGKIKLTDGKPKTAEEYLKGK